MFDVEDGRRREEEIVEKMGSYIAFKVIIQHYMIFRRKEWKSIGKSRRGQCAQTKWERAQDPSICEILRLR